MENGYENFLMVDSLKHEKDTQFFKFDGSPMKPDKQIFIEMPSCLTSKYQELCRSIDQNSKTFNDKQKTRPYLNTHTEAQCPNDTKSPKTKKNLEQSIQNCSKVPFLPLLSIRTNVLEELYKESKDLKVCVADLEEKSKVNTQCVEMNKVRIEDLENRLRKLNQKAGFGCSYEERKEELNHKLKNLQGNWKKSCLQLRQHIQDMEEDLINQMSKLDSLKNQLFKKGQQQLMLAKNMNESISHSETGSHSCDLLNSPNKLRILIHTPSLNSIYH